MPKTQVKSAGRKHKKAKERVPAIHASDVVFGTLVRDEMATVVAEQGIVVLKVDGDPHPYFLPAGIKLGHEAYGQEVDITIRNITQEVILELGEDDIYESDLEKDERLMPVDEWQEVKELFNELKIQLFTQNIKVVSTFFSGILLSVVCGVLLKSGFRYTLPLYVGLPLGILISLGLGLRPIIKLIRQLNSKVICDAANNYINVETGKTNMNGGMIIPV